jgi:hypothetical protein
MLKRRLPKRRQKSIVPRRDQTNFEVDAAASRTHETIARGAARVLCG